VEDTAISQTLIAGEALPQTDSVQRLFELSLDMLGTASADGYFTRLNPAWEQSLGWTREELMSKPYISFVHPDDVESTAAQAGRLASPGAEPAIAFENRYRTKAGGYRRVQWTTVPDGEIAYFVAKDVTDLRAAEVEEARAELLIHRSEALHRTLTANLPDTSVFLLDHDLRILLAEGEAIRRLPWSGEDQFRGRKVTDLFSEVPDDAFQLSVENYTAVLRGERRSFEFVSEGVTIAVQAVPVLADDGSVESALVVVRDITERTNAEQQIARRAQQQKTVAELGRFALQSHDLAELMAEAATTATATLGVDGAGVFELGEGGESLTIVAGVGLPEGSVGPGRIPLSEAAEVGYTIATGAPVIVEQMATEKRFEPSPTVLKLGIVSSLSVPIEGRSHPFGVLNVHSYESRQFSDDEVEFLTAIATLIVVAVERNRDEQATRHAALHDPLTGLPNRTLALDRLSQALARRQRKGIEVGVLMLDLDRFKIINDSLGHAAGDEALLALAPRLTAAVRPSDTVARLGGDEFVVICPDVDGARGVTQIAKRLASAVNRPVVLNSGEHFFTVSTGITLASQDDVPESMLRDADAAMYRAKERGRGRYELFDEQMRTTVMARVQIEAELRCALERGELCVWYQPVIELPTGRIVSTEALVRWQHPERGLVSPMDFIPIAEESGLIAELGLQVLERACRQTAAWQRQLDQPLGLSVNVSGRQLINPGFPAQVASIAAHSGLRAGTLALELTETVLMDDEFDSPAEALAALHEQGLTIALDDFGTGYSSLSRLKNLPVDVLKIDRSFVSGVARNANDRAIVKATIEMAHAVGLIVVGEGVETQEQADYLRVSGCDRVQGYLYARPQPAEAITQVLAAA
jgi:diguanylate cyclase (GGDEF)-like protein/PAS domain S-box-containing protein